MGLRRRIGRAWATFRAPTFPRPGEASRASLLAHYLARVVVQVTRQSARDRLLRQAASLSFQTLVSAVPVAVVALSVLTRVISLQEVDELARWLSQHMLPSRASAIATVLSDLATSVDVGALGIAGAIGLLVVGVFLFMNVSAVVDDIWRVRRKRPLVYRVVLALVLLIFVPAMTGLSIYLLQRFVRLPGSTGLLVPLAVTVASLWVAYRLVPATRVSALSAGVAALCVGALLEAGKTGFGLYVARIEMTTRGLYGAIGFIPLALLWLYLSWLFFLFGVELSHTVQNLRTLWLRDAYRHRASTGSTAGSGLALRVLLEVYRAGRATPADLAVAIGAAPQAVDLVTDHLVAAGLLLAERDREMTPSRPVGAVLVVEVLGLYAGGRLEPGDGGDRPGLEALLERLDQAQEREAGHLTIEDLLEDEDSQQQVS